MMFFLRLVNLHWTGARCPVVPPLELNTFVLTVLTVGLTVLTLHSFMEARIRHCGIFILWSRLFVLTLNGKPARQEFLPPLTQLMTKCKRRTKFTGKIKRSKQSHSYYSNSVATDRLVLAGDVETNSGPDDAKTGRKKSVQNIPVKKSCLACNKTIRLNQKELTCNLCSGSFNFITNAKLENWNQMLTFGVALDVNFRRYLIPFLPRIQS